MRKLKLSGFSDEISPVFDEQLKTVRKLGLSNIELRNVDGVNVSELTPQKCKEVKEKLRESGVSVSSIGSPIGKISIADDFSSHMEKLKRTLEIQKELDAPYVRIFSFYLPAAETPEQFRAQVFERISAFIEEASKWGSVLLHENEKQIYGDTAPRCRELMKEFYGPHFRAVFDFANFVEVGQDTVEAFELLRPYIEYVHIKDALKAEGRIVPAGMGDGRVKELLAELIGSGWRGFLSLEPHLVNFSGLAALEQDAKRRDTSMDGKTAWKLALDALTSILSDIPEGKEALV